MKTNRNAAEIIKPDRRKKDRRWSLLRYAKKVGLTRERVIEIMKTSGKECNICDGRAKVNDHDHKLKEHRGRLCQACNLAIGLMEDNPERLRAAAFYLEEFYSSFVEYDLNKGTPVKDDVVIRR